MIQINAALCDVCGTCVCVCPVNALMIIDALTVNMKTCISCGRCVVVCPFGALKLVPDNTREEPHD